VQRCSLRCRGGAYTKRNALRLLCRHQSTPTVNFRLTGVRERILSRNSAYHLEHEPLTHFIIRTHQLDQTLGHRPSTYHSACMMQLVANCHPSPHNNTHCTPPSPPGL
jgi:hypothetical protein